MDERKNIKTYLSFTLAGELFAIDVRNVVKILQMQKITKIPQSPPYLKGIINIRGNVIPVVDMYNKFGFKTPDNFEDLIILIFSFSLEEEENSVGIIVDRANEVFEAESDLIKDYPSLSQKYNANFISGVYKKDDDFVLILEINKIFSSEDIAEIQMLG